MALASTSSLFFSSYSDFPIDTLPELVVLKIFDCLNYDQVAKLRIVSRFFNRMCKQHLNRGFQRVEKIQSQYLKELKGKLPRRESARRNHPFSRHCDILTAIDTRMNLLSMTFGKYIDARLCCFIPGKIIDEIYNVLRILKSSVEPPRTYEVLQELRDISSMAMEHFDDKVVPSLIKRHQHHRSTSNPSAPCSSPIVSSGSLGTPSRILSSPEAALFVAAAAAGGSPTTPGGIGSRILGPSHKVMRDEFIAHKKKMSEIVNKHKVTSKKIFKKQNEKIENLQRTVNAQAALISSQTEMLKEINKKLLENEQKLADFLHTKGVVCGKRHAIVENDSNVELEDSTSAKKMKMT